MKQCPSWAQHLETLLSNPTWSCCTWLKDQYTRSRSRRFHWFEETNKQAWKLKTWAFEHISVQSCQFATIFTPTSVGKPSSLYGRLIPYHSISTFRISASGWDWLFKVVFKRPLSNFIIRNLYHQTPSPSLSLKSHTHHLQSSKDSIQLWIWNKDE